MTTLCETSRTLLADALSIPAAEITEATSLTTTPAWDSLAHMRIVLAVEETIGRQLTPDEIVSVMSAEDVAKLVS